MSYFGKKISRLRDSIFRSSYAWKEKQGRETARVGGGGWVVNAPINGLPQDGGGGGRPQGNLKI